jgi:hypothetical protein
LFNPGRNYEVSMSGPSLSKAGFEVFSRFRRQCAAGDAKQTRRGGGGARQLAATAAPVCTRTQMGLNGPRWARAGHALWSRRFGSASAEGWPQGGPPATAVAATT